VLRRRRCRLSRHRANCTGPDPGGLWETDPALQPSQPQQVHRYAHAPSQPRRNRGNSVTTTSVPAVINRELHAGDEQPASALAGGPQAETDPAGSSHRICLSRAICSDQAARWPGSPPSCSMPRSPPKGARALDNEPDVKLPIATRASKCGALAQAKAAAASSCRRS